MSRETHAFCTAELRRCEQVLHEVVSEPFAPDLKVIMPFAEDCGAFWAAPLFSSGNIQRPGVLFENSLCKGHG